ncbi:MAG: response regulator [Deltaproteobacteria bacterium]|nr:response regulator [Deltaproteobacteria bacterium]MBW2106982.1 response regulator [Deltaproteobacteria bacterium]
MSIFDESYSPIDLARILGIHRVTVTNWIKKGALKAIRTPGGRYRVSKDELISFLHAHGMPIPAFLRVKERKLVVAVDDEEMILNLLEQFFSTNDMPYMYKLATFSNPIEAAFFIGDRKPDLIILDLLMPELNGFNIAGKIQQASPHSKIIVLTGHATHDNIARLKKYNISAVLTKPVNLKILKKSIENALI